MSWRRDERGERSPIRDRRSNSSERSDFRRRDRSRDRDRRPRRRDHYRHEEPPPAPSPPRISRSPAYEERRYEDRRVDERRNEDRRSDERRSDERRSPPRDEPANGVSSPGDWYCLCGSFNFRRRSVCYRRCGGRRSEGIVYGDQGFGITKKLLFRRLDALTTEEKILEAIKGVCSKKVIDSISGITIGRETLTGASKCLAYVDFNTVTDSSAALAELLALEKPLIIDDHEVLISYYNEPTRPKAEYQYKNAPTSSASTTHVTPPTQALPTGDGLTVYKAPDVLTFLYDETSGYYYDPATGLYYDGNTQYFYNSQTTQYMYWDAARSTYIAAAQTQQNTQPKLPDPPTATVQNTIAQEPVEKKKKDKEDKVKVAKKIAKDMERWARAQNQKKEQTRYEQVAEPPVALEMPAAGPSRGAADIGFSVLGGATPRPDLTRPILPDPTPEEFLFKKPEFEDSDDGIIDWVKLMCLLCKRKFPSAEVLTKHKTMSDLHKQNLAEHRKNEPPQNNAYRDRAAERRLKFGEEETPPVRKARYAPEPPPSYTAPPEAVHDTIGGKMLQKMGWSHGRGLGKDEQGRIAPIEAEQRPALVGLGQKKGIYTPTPGETYRDTVKKLMIARYKEVTGQDEEN